MPDTSVLGGAASVATATGGDSPHYNEDLNELNAEEIVETEQDTETTETEESEEVSTEISKDTEEDEETEETEEEPVKIPFERPSIKEIKEKYPDLFKDFPAIKDSIFREAEFTKLFPTVDDAKEAFTDNEAFTTLSDAVLSGDPIPLLDSVEKTDKKALEVFSASFLPALYKKNQELYDTVVTPLFQNLVRQMYKSGKDDNTKNAALVIADWIFGDENGEAIVKGTKTAIKGNLVEDQRKLKETKDQEISTKFRAFAADVEPKIGTALEATIMKQLDPKKELFSPFLRRTGAKEVAKRISTQLQADAGHMQVMGAWWKRAKNNGYPDDYKDKIVSTYLARAKSLIPSIAAKVAADMLGTKVKAAGKLSERTKPVDKQNNSGRVANGNSGHTKVDYNKMSDMDILNS